MQVRPLYIVIKMCTLTDDDDDDDDDDTCSSYKLL